MSRLSIPNDFPVDLIGPDISAYRKSNTGIDYIWSFEAPEPGPHVMVSAIVHGNEPAGAVALDWLLSRDVRPLSGTLTLAFMNVEAYARFDVEDPNASRWADEDFNRVWAVDVLDGGRDSIELRRAREVRPIVASVDHLLDIHTMQRPAPPVMMSGWLDKGVELSRLIGVPERIVMDRGHAAGLRMRDHGGFSDPNSPKSAALIECGQHWQNSSGELAIESALRFLVGLGMVDPDLLAHQAFPDPAPQSVWEVTEAVTIESDLFEFAQNFSGGEILSDAGTLIGHDGSRAVRSPYAQCMLVMPSKRLWKGQTAVRLACERPSG